MDDDFDRARSICLVSLGLCLLLSLASVAFAVGAWPGMPARVPTHFGASGTPDAWSDKSVAAVFVMPLMGMVMGPLMALFGLTAVGRENRPPADRKALRAALPSLAIFLAVLAVLATALLSGISITANRVALGSATGLGWWPLVAGTGVGAWAIGGAIWFLAKHSPIGGGQDALHSDPSRWKWGAFYVAPDDPSLWVEKRWGGGYTINFGIPAGRRIGWAMLAILAGVLALVGWLIVSL